jgi:hypothetical protein
MKSKVRRKDKLKLRNENGKEYTSPSYTVRN